jgi:hypothetical protein
VYFEPNGGRLAPDANGGPAGWTNFEIKMYKSVEGRDTALREFSPDFVNIVHKCK